jgi:hypothetical protein
VNQSESKAAPTAEQPPEQLLYATLLNWFTHLGLAVLVLAFAAYVMGWVKPHVPLERLPELWSHPVADYLAQTHTPTGWGWTALLQRSDMMGLAGIAILAGGSVICLLSLVPLYASRGDKAFVLVCLADAAVVLLAASGIFTAVH